MEQSTTDLIKGVIGSMVRHLLTGVAGALAIHGWITPSQGTQLIEAAIVGVVAIAWALFRKYKVNEKINTALGLPAGTSRETLDTVVKQG